MKDFIRKPISLHVPNFTQNVWGGRWIPQLKNLPAQTQPVGESWEFSAHSLHPNSVEIGPGKTMEITKLIEAFPNEILGIDVVKKWGPKAPLLVKFIDAQENLSVQVHPGDAYAQKHEGDSGKTESWIMLAPGIIYLGFNPAHAKNYSSQEEFKKAFHEAINIKDARQAVLPFLNKISVKPGEVYDLNPGTIHAIGKGSRLVEVQQSSGVTYRVWDWGRSGRALHIKKALDVLNFEAHEPAYFSPAPQKINAHLEQLISHAEVGYVAQRIHLKNNENIKMETHGAFQVLTVVSGEIELNEFLDDKRERVKTGMTVLIPAQLASYQLRALAQAIIIKSAPI